MTVLFWSQQAAQTSPSPEQHLNLSTPPPFPDRLRLSWLTHNQRYLVGCLHFCTDSIHSCPLLEAPCLLLLCSVGLPLKREIRKQCMEECVDGIEYKNYEKRKMRDDHVVLVVNTQTRLTRLLAC